MAKIRGIKPEFWSDEDVVELSMPARLLYIGLWSYACDNGHLADKSRQIKMRIFPGDDVNVAELLRELSTSGRIERDGGFITIPNLREHQRPDLRYFTTCDKSGCEDPPEKLAQRAARRAHAVHTTGAQEVPAVGTPSAHVDGDGDGDGDGELKGSARGTGAASGTRISEDFRVTPSMREWAQGKGYGSLDLDGITEEFIDYWIALPGAKGRKLDWERTWQNRVRDVAGRLGVRGLRVEPTESLWANANRPRSAS